MKIAFLLLLLLHGLIHLMGFSKAFYPASVSQLKINITKAEGVLWLITALLFVTTAILLMAKNPYWWLYAAIAFVLSQCLVILAWNDAKYGSIVNIIILLVTIAGYSTWNYHHKYKADVQGYLSTNLKEDILSEPDIQQLPDAVKKYLRYSGCINRPKVNNFRIVFKGQIRKDEASEWMPFTSEQYNFLNPAVRLFFMNANMKHMPVAGFHSYKNGTAFMDIRLLSLFKVQYQDGKEMGIAETVTFFNDMCCMAPATLIDKRINWAVVDSNTVKALFTNNGITISAILHFNAEGALINFISGDRYADTDEGMKKLQWSTPLKDYKNINGYRLAGYADAVYKYPTGDLCYGNFRLTSIEYNVKK